MDDIGVTARGLLEPLGQHSPLAGVPPAEEICDDQGISGGTLDHRTVVAPRVTTGRAGNPFCQTGKRYLFVLARSSYYYIEQKPIW